MAQSVQAAAAFAGILIRAASIGMPSTDGKAVDHGRFGNILAHRHHGPHIICPVHGEIVLYIIPIQVAGEEGGEICGVPSVLQPFLRAGKAAVQLHIFIQNETSVGTASRAIRPVKAFGHPDDIPFGSGGEGILQAGEGIYPGGAIVGAGSVAFDVKPVAERLAPPFVHSTLRRAGDDAAGKSGPGV